MVALLLDDEPELLKVTPGAVLTTPTLVLPLHDLGLQHHLALNGDLHGAQVLGHLAQFIGRAFDHDDTGTRVEHDTTIGPVAQHRLQ
jgi:hypothetical protein